MRRSDAERKRLTLQPKAASVRRNLSTLTERQYDLAVVGGGIYGISVARDAALRGFTVALVEQGDFGSATSSNLHKIIHGGLRYLQHGDLKRMRESIRERSILMRIAPHLVEPLPFLIPIYRHARPGKFVAATALKLNDLIGFDRNRDLDPHKIIPPGRIISPDHCRQLCPLLDATGLTGGALFYDAQVHNVDRLNLSLLLSATRAGADAANYAQVTGFLRDGNTVKGIRVKDVFSEDIFDMRARFIVNCAGPWIDRLLQPLGIPSSKNIGWCKAVVLVTRRLIQDIAVGLQGRCAYEDRDAMFHKGYRLFFVTPWRAKSLIGTFQAPQDGNPDDIKVSERELQQYIQEINAAFPEAAIQRRDVHFIYRGLLPITNERAVNGDINLMKHFAIIDHAEEHDVEGLLSVRGVKYSTARDVAEKVVDLAGRKLGGNSPTCQTASTPVDGGDRNFLQAFKAGQLETPAGLSPEVFDHLIRTYGSDYQRILKYCYDDRDFGAPVTPGSLVIRAEVLHGVRYEMAQTLADVVFRRTELGTDGYPGDTCLRTCAGIVSAELRWDQQKTRHEIEAVTRAFAERGSNTWQAPARLA
jgi:glycerol-3-phosphate dehydrogenase